MRTTAAALSAMLTLSAISAQIPAFARTPQPDRTSPVSVEYRLAVPTTGSIGDAIAKGSAFIATRRGANVTIRLDAGTFDLSGAQGRAAIDVSRIDACPGRLTISGAGMTRTTIIKSDDGTGVLGRGASCIAFTDMTFTQRRLEISQGRVISADTSAIVLDIPTGFPTPGAMAAAPTKTDRFDLPRYWVKRFVQTATGPQIVENERHVRWTSASRVVGATGRWRLTLATRPGGKVYHPGDWLGITAKSGGQTYRFVNGHDISFRNVRWLVDARGKFFQVDRVTIDSCVITPPPPINGVHFFLATSGGGPQIGQRHGFTSGHLVVNNRFDHTGDDSIAFAHASGVIRGNRISDATRGIFLIGSPDTKLENNDLVRAPVRYGSGLGRRRVGSRPDTTPE